MGMRNAVERRHRDALFCVQYDNSCTLHCRQSTWLSALPLRHLPSLTPTICLSTALILPLRYGRFQVGRIRGRRVSEKTHPWLPLLIRVLADSREDGSTGPEQGPAPGKRYLHHRIPDSAAEHFGPRKPRDSSSVNSAGRDTASTYCFPQIVGKLRL